MEPLLFLMIIIVFALIAILIEICQKNCECDDGRTRTNYQWNPRTNYHRTNHHRTNHQWNTRTNHHNYGDYGQNNTFTTGNDYITNEIREIEIPMDRDFSTTYTETPAAGGLASDIGSAFSDMFSGGGFDSGGGDTGGGDTGDTGGGDTGDTGGGDTGDTAGSSYD